MRPGTRPSALGLALAVGCCLLAAVASAQDYAEAGPCASTGMVLRLHHARGSVHEDCGLRARATGRLCLCALAVRANLDAHASMLGTQSASRPPAPNHAYRHACPNTPTHKHKLAAVTTLLVHLPKQFDCRCQCSVNLVLTVPSAGGACPFAAPFPTVLFTSGFQVWAHACGAARCACTAAPVADSPPPPAPRLLAACRCAVRLARGTLPLLPPPLTNPLSRPTPHPPPLNPRRPRQQTTGSTRPAWRHGALRSCSTTSSSSALTSTRCATRTRQRCVACARCVWCCGRARATRWRQRNCPP
jgi:hypothetical protein